MHSLFSSPDTVKCREVPLTDLTVTVPSIVHVNTPNSLSPLSAPLSTLLHFYSIQQLTHLDQIYLIQPRCWKEEDIFFVYSLGAAMLSSLYCQKLWRLLRLWPGVGLCQQQCCKSIHRFHNRFHNHGEGTYQGLFLVESIYQHFHI